MAHAFAPAAAAAAAAAPSFFSKLPSQLPGVGSARAAEARRGGGGAVGGVCVGNGNATAAEQKLLAFKRQIESSMQQVRGSF